MDETFRYHSIYSLSTALGAAALVRLLKSYICGIASKDGLIYYVRDSRQKNPEVGRMRKVFAYMIISLFILAAGQQTVLSAGKEDVITNETIVKMVKAKLGDTLIIKKIKTSKTDFDLSTEAIIDLKKAGASEKIIEAMMGGEAQDTPNVQQAQSGVQSIPSDSVILNAENRKIELENTKFEQFVPSRFFLKAALIPFGLRKQDWGKYVNGTHSKIRISANKPTFVIRTIAKQLEDVKLIRMDVHESKNIRYFTIIQRNLTGTEFILAKKEYEVPFDSRRTGNGLEITPKEPLAPGEYVITTWTNFSNGYDFGVDGPSESATNTDLSSKEKVNPD